MTSKKTRRHNALLHGVHSRDIILPGERPEDLDAVLTNTRLEFGLRGTTQDETVSGIAGLRWTARRINRLCQHAFVELARELEKSGKRSVDDSRRSRRVEKQRGKVNDTNAVVQLSEAFASIADELKRKGSLGKLGANMRSAMNDMEKLLPIIAAQAKSFDEGKRIDRAFKRLQLCFELGARNDAQIIKKIQMLVMIKEFQRQYGQDSNVKLLSHDPRTADDAATSVTQVGGKASSKKTTDDNDNWDGNDNDNDNDNGIDPNDYDWEHEYDEAVAEQEKARRGHRTQND